MHRLLLFVLLAGCTQPESDADKLHRLELEVTTNRLNYQATEREIDSLSAIRGGSAADGIRLDSVTRAMRMKADSWETAWKLAERDLNRFNNGN